MKVTQPQNGHTWLLQKLHRCIYKDNKSPLCHAEIDWASSGNGLALKRGGWIPRAPKLVSQSAAVLFTLFWKEEIKRYETKKTNITRHLLTKVQ